MRAKSQQAFRGVSGKRARQLSSGLCRTSASPSRAVHRLKIWMSRLRRWEASVSHPEFDLRPAQSGNDGQLVGFFRKQVGAKADRRSARRALELAARILRHRSGRLPSQGVSRR